MMMNDTLPFKNQKIVIGMIHFGPLLGYADTFDIDTVLQDAIADLEALIAGDVDAIMVENNYDTPHQITVGPETIACMTYLTAELGKRTKLPLGVSVLWNDYAAALAIARVTGASFVRVPVFVDHVKTSYGEVSGDAKSVLECRSKMGATNIMILADIHVKHSKILNHETIEESAAKAINGGADALIVTGKWTGDMPDLRELASIRRAIGNFPVVVGSGATATNAKQLAKYADGVIVSTSIKGGNLDTSEVNMKNHTLRVDVAKTTQFVKAFKTGHNYYSR